MKTRVFWLVACVIPYVLWLFWVGAFTSQPTPWEEKDTYMWIALGILGFPGSVIWFYVAATGQVLLERSGIHSTNIYIIDTVIWLGSVFVGYLQWFYIAPWLKKLIFRRQRS